MTQHKSLRAKSFRILRPYIQNSPGEWPSRLFDYFLILLILSNALAMMLDTVPAFTAQWKHELHIFDLFSVAIFTVEYFARLWTCVELHDDKHASEPLWKRRLRYMVSPMAIIDLLGILPFYLSMFINIDLRVLRLLRLTRLIKLGRYSRSAQLLWQVLRNEAKTLVAALSIMLIVMTFAATGIYYIERAAQPEEFGTIPSSMWWALVTLTTVGYGDVVPITTAGKVFGGMITMLGVALYAIPAGILSSSFTAQLQLRRDRFRDVVTNAMEDGHLSLTEMQHIDKIREILNLDAEEAELIIRLLRHRSQHTNEPFVVPAKTSPSE